MCEHLWRSRKFQLSQMLAAEGASFHNLYLFFYQSAQFINKFSSLFICDVNLTLEDGFAVGLS